MLYIRFLEILIFVVTLRLFSVLSILIELLPDHLARLFRALYFYLDLQFGWLRYGKVENVDFFETCEPVRDFVVVIGKDDDTKPTTAIQNVSVIIPEEFLFRNVEDESVQVVGTNGLFIKVKFCNKRLSDDILTWVVFGKKNPDCFADIMSVAFVTQPLKPSENYNEKRFVFLNTNCLGGMNIELTEGEYNHNEDYFLIGRDKKANMFYQINGEIYENIMKYVGYTALEATDQNERLTICSACEISESTPMSYIDSLREKLIDEAIYVRVYPPTTAFIIHYMRNYLLY